VMAANEEEATEEDELEWYSRRLDAGLSSLQNADYVLAWVCMEEDGVSCFNCNAVPADELG
jgi:beta-catenin-like protein 1